MFMSLTSTTADADADVAVAEAAALAVAYSLSYTIKVSMQNVGKLQKCKKYKKHTAKTLLLVFLCGYF